MRPRRRQRSVLVGGTVLAVFALSILAHTWWRVFHPSLAAPGRSDALVVLGPSNPTRVAYASHLMREGAARELIVSAHPADTPQGTPAPCTQRLPYPVRCFDPVPSTTQGEARAIAMMARERGWGSIQVVTFIPQVERARLILGRCTNLDVRYLDSGEDYDTQSQAIYQIGGFIKAFATPYC